ncbi:nitrilase-related carbon-nitrogen hydrolase [Streptomyces sp. M19]
MRAALVQLAVNPDEPVESRRNRAAALVREQAGADLVVLPELWHLGAFAFTSFETGAEPWTAHGRGHGVRRARRRGLAARGLDRGARPRGRPLQHLARLLPEGERAATYRKIHRFGFDRGEATLMSAGEEPVTVALPDTTVGLATCYDLRFPELFRLLTEAGAETLVIPAGWPARRAAHWTLLARARAVENQTYVLACGTAGSHAGVEQAGRSIAVDPWGEVLAEAGTDEEVLSVELDPERVATTRADFPALRDRRLGLPEPHRA